MILFGIPVDDPILRVATGTVIGMLIGFERAREHQVTGIRTLGLVGLASALLTTVMATSAGADFQGLSRAVQGLITGIGFLGAGVILRGRHRVHGLTTAAAIWTTTILGIAAGIGEIALALGSAVVVYGFLALGDRADDWIYRRFGKAPRKDDNGRSPDQA